jgi:esterase FrsA
VTSSATVTPSVNASVQGRPKTLEEAQQWMRERLIARTHPMNLIDVEEGLALIGQLHGLDGENWASVWGGAGDRVRAEAEAAAARGDVGSSQQLFMRAHGLYFMGRFPSPTHPAKLRCAELERDTYIKAGEKWSCPVRRVVVPFAGRVGEGHEVVFLHRRPAGVRRPPVVVMWGGVDAWKEQMTAATEAFLNIGIATIALDNVGTGESPVRGVVDAERQFLPVFDWVAEQTDLHGAKVGLLGRSFGGYWATKLAHLYPQRIAGAVNWGGGAHHMFQPEWVEASRYPDSYLMDLVETRCRMLGATNDAEYVAFFKRLSLFGQGLLERPCAPLLLVNGKLDRQCPIEDVHLLTEHGSPKAVRLFPGGHMGLTPRTLPTIVEWLAGRLGAAP